MLSGELQQMTAEEDRWRIYSDLAIPAKDYLNALRVRRRVQRELDRLLAPFDALVTPTLARVSGPVDQPFHAWSGSFDSTDIGGAANIAGIPAISIPNGFGAGELPTGLQLTGRACEENRLLHVAREYQSRTDWHQRRPPLFEE